MPATRHQLIEVSSMTVTLDELLTLAGRLDDSSGFDTPRERFRRFLVEHAADARIVRSLIEQCQHAPGDQHHRALQDLVVVLGRALGFDARFGSYLPAAGSIRAHGHWHSRRLDVALEIRTDQARAADFDLLSRSVSALEAASASTTAVRAVGLCVLTPLYTNREWLDEIPAAEGPEARVQAVTLGSLLSVADLIGARRLTHDDVVKLLETGAEFELIVRLLERAAGMAGSEPSASTPAPVDVQAGTGYWLATVGGDQGATPEQFAEIVIGRRRLFGISEGGTSAGAPQRGDGICFHVPGKGVVGHGRVRSTLEDGAGLRDAHRFSHLLHLDDVVLHLTAPVPLDEELQLRVRATRAARTAHSVTRIAQQEFERLATIREVRERRGIAAAENASPGEDVEPVSAGDSRSHE